MSEMKNGKKPISQKPQKLLRAEDLWGTNDIPPDVAADLKKRGLVPRWLNAKVVYANQGYGKKGWEIYKRPEGMARPAFVMGTDPDGIVRKDDLILGCKTVEAHREHRALLDQQANRQRKVMKEQGNDLRAHARAIGLQTEVDDSLDKEDD